MTQCMGLGEWNLKLQRSSANPTRCSRDAVFVLAYFNTRMKFRRELRPVTANGVELTKLCAQCVNMDRVWGTYRTTYRRLYGHPWGEEVDRLLGFAALCELSGVAPRFSINSGLTKAPAVGHMFYRLRVSEMPRDLQKLVKSWMVAKEAA